MTPRRSVPSQPLQIVLERIIDLVPFTLLEVKMAISDQAGAEPSDRQPHGPYWDTPHLYGEAEALNSMGTIAAPLLAGFSLAAMVQTITINTGQARWPDAALLLFMLAAVLFVTAV